jgi:hypothetical protein
LLPALALIAIALARCGRDPEGASTAATLILHGGKVFTADQAKPWAEAIAIAGDRILAVGADTEVLALAGESTERVDLGRRVVIPGLNDAHVHTAASLPWHDLGLPFDPPVPELPPELALSRAQPRILGLRAQNPSWPGATRSLP